MIKLLSTKKLDTSTIAYAQSLQLDVTCAEFIQITPVLWEESVLKEFAFDSVAFTSSSGVKYFLSTPDAVEWIKTKNVFSIEGKTSEELIKHGVDAVINAKDANQLTEVVKNRKLTGSVLHVCGNMRLDVLEKKLNDAGINYYPLVVYHTALITNLRLEEEFDAILFYSPSGVDGFLSCNNVSAKTVCCCIGNTTAAKLRQRASNSKIMVSPFPSPKSMLERVANYFAKTSE